MSVNPRIPGGLHLEVPVPKIRSRGSAGYLEKCTWQVQVGIRRKAEGDSYPGFSFAAFGIPICFEVQGRGGFEERRRLESKSRAKTVITGWIQRRGLLPGNTSRRNRQGLFSYPIQKKAGSQWYGREGLNPFEV